MYEFITIITKMIVKEELAGNGSINSFWIFNSKNLLIVSPVGIMNY